MKVTIYKDPDGRDVIVGADVVTFAEKMMFVTRDDVFTDYEYRNIISILVDLDVGTSIKVDVNE